ncbi:MAG: hemolysin family protein [Flavobacteriales bacterium]
MPDPASSIVVILVSLLGSAFFSGMEIAFVSANRLQLELDSKQGFRGQLLAQFVKRPELFIATMLVGNNLALVFCGIESGALISQTLFDAADWNTAASPFLALSAQTVITTIIVLVLAEFIPKSLFHADPNHWLRIFALPLALLHWLLILPGLLVVGLSHGTLRLVGGNRRLDDEQAEERLGATDLDHFIREISGRMEPEQELEHELQIMQNALEFSKIQARDCLIPRNEVIAVDIETPVDEVRDLFVSTGLSKIVIYRGDIDHIVGYVHSKDLFRMPEEVKHILHPTFVVPEPMAADELLRLFMQRRRHLAVVVDEFGGTSGILTMEDIMEELVGDIEDEHDFEELVEEEIEAGYWRFSARLDAEDLNERYGLNLPLHEAYDTLGGLILHEAEDIPEPGFTLPIADCILEVESVEQNRIGLVRVRALGEHK